MTEGDEPAGVLSERGVQELPSIDPEVPIIADDGTIACGLDLWQEDYADSCAAAYRASLAHPLTANGLWSMMNSTSVTG